MAKKKTRRKTGAKKRAPARGRAAAGARRPRGLSSASVGELRQELRRRERRLTSLEGKRAKLLEQLASLESEMDQLGSLVASGGGVGGTGRKRPRNTQNLVDALADLLNGQELSVTEAAAEVQRAGYRTNSENFRTIVNQTLINSGRFKRTSRGIYTTK